MRAPHAHVVPPLAPGGHLALTEAELVAWGEAFGRSAEPPLIVAVSGDLGAGKTTLVRAICRGYGVTEAVTSPTYTLVNEYRVPPAPSGTRASAAHSLVYHLDLYRLGDERAVAGIGWDDIMGAHALVLVEWPERAGDAFPGPFLHMELEHMASDPERRLLLAG
ncbi:MAG: tRNA (adenosine(37)-N6)-threonylcarbamoyltransferase complex ATPase subunit type 1 TsaE [Gemmatimonadaceae bacterium]